jgi:hypothetical protein
MAEVVYALCAVTSIVCAALVLRAWAAGRATLLLWAGACFIGLALNNLLLFADEVLVRGTDLSTWRQVPAAAGIAALVFGLVREERRP